MLMSAILPGVIATATILPQGVVDRLGGAVFGRDIAPARSCLEDVEDAADHPSVVDTGPTRLVARQMRFETRPRIVR